MTNKEQIIKVAHYAAGLARLARSSREPVHLIKHTRNILEILWEKGCHSDQLTGDEKETCRRCVLAVEKMLTV